MKRFGLLILVAAFWSALSISTFKVVDQKEGFSKNTQLVPTSIKSVTQLGQIQQADIELSEELDVQECTIDSKICFEADWLRAFSSCNQRSFHYSFLSFFDNDPFSRIYRSSV